MRQTKLKTIHPHGSANAARGFTLVELLVVIAIIGTLVGLLLPAVQAAREAARNNTCKNNIKQLQIGLSTRESSLGDYPGYVNELGISGSQLLIRASWVVYTFPYIEQVALWENWSQGRVNPSNNGDLSIERGERAQIEILVCPSDPAISPGQPLLSYAANAGWIDRTQSNLGTGGGTGPSPPQSRFQRDQENPANGVFFSRIRNQPNALNLGPSDNQSIDQGDKPLIKMTPALIKDGLSETVMFSENLRAVNWAFTSAEAYDPSGGGPGNEKYQFGICWEQPDALATAIANQTAQQVRRVNGNTESETTDRIEDMTIDDGFPSSLHPAGVNVAFMGGSVSFVTDSISPVVYAQIMTSDRKNSDLHTGNGSNRNQYEEFLPIVSSSDF